MFRTKTFICVLLVVTFISESVAANSYLDMITTVPEGYIVQKSSNNSTVIVSNSNPEVVYVAGIKTKSPVVTSDYHKYQAWLQSQANNDYPYVHSDVQRFIYFVSGAFAMRLAYDIFGPHHRHHLLH